MCVSCSVFPAVHVSVWLQSPPEAPWCPLQVCRGWDSSLWAEDMDSDGDVMVLADDLDCRSHNSSPVRRRAQQRPNRVRGALNRSCSVPDSNNPPCFSPPAHGDISIPVTDLTEIGAEEHVSCESMWSQRLQRLSRGRSCESRPHSGSEDAAKSFVNYQPSHGDEDPSETRIQDSTPPCVTCQELDRSSENHSLYIPNNHMTKSMLCLNEESQDEVSGARWLFHLCSSVSDCLCCFFIVS